MLQRPNEQIYDVIRYFGSRGKIFNVHFRNIQGGFLNFRETFPDNGDVDMPRAFSYCFGYINALLQQLRLGA